MTTKRKLSHPASGTLSRPPLERMLRIHNEIQTGDYPNASALAAELEVSTKSIYRDIDFMRDRMDLPIEFDSVRNGYHYTQNVSSFPAIQVTEGELFALLVAEKALQQYRGTNFEKPLVSAFKKMASTLPDSISLNLADWNQTISFHTRAEPILHLDIINTLSKATARQQQISLAYRKPGRVESETRVVDPYHLANINGEWFLFAFDHLRNALRTFVPARIQSVTLTGKSFVRPKKFSLDKQLRDSFGVHSGQGEYDVRIRFNAYAADFIREKKWHDSQQLTDLTDGGLELRLKLSSLTEIERWILSWGGNAVALHPPELAASLKKAAEKTLAAYA